MTFKLNHSAGALCLVLAWGPFAAAEDDAPAAGAASSKRWIDDDIEAAYARAQATGKPLLVSFR